MNGLISLISTVAGAALFFHKNKDVDAKGSNTKTDTSTIDPTESSYQEYKQKVEEAQAMQEANDPRNKRMYLGNPTAPYDAFYDYSNDRIYNTPDSVRNLDDDLTSKACRARLVSPYLLSEEVERKGIDDSDIKKLSVIGALPIGSQEVKNLGGLANYYKRYFDPNLYIPDATIDGSLKFVATQARGNFRYVTFYIEIFNPCDREIELQMCGVSNIMIGDNKCQPVHIGGDLPYGEDFTMGENEKHAKHYMYDFAGFNISDRGNKWWHAARDLQVEPFKGGKSVECKWKEMAYPYILCDNIFENGYSNQNWNDVAAGLNLYRTGWATYDKEKSREKNYEPNYLKIDSMSSEIVKMTLPLASMDDTKVYYAPEGELFDWDFRKGKIERIFSSIGVPDSEFEEVKPTDLLDNGRYVGRDMIYSKYYANLHNKGISDYLRFDFKPAPSLSGKVFQITLTLANKIGQYYPKGDKDFYQQKDDNSPNVKSFDLKFVPGARPANMSKEWHYSYIDDQSIPDESKSRSTQLGIIQKKFNYAYEDTINEAFDASANN